MFAHGPPLVGDRTSLEGTVQVQSAERVPRNQDTESSPSKSKQF